MRNRLLCLAAALLALVALPSFTRAQTAAAAPEAKKAAAKETVPDLSGNWNSGAGASWNPSDRAGKRLEDGTPYQPWALAKLKSERPGFGPNATFENTTDPNIISCDPEGLPRIFFVPAKFRFVQTPDVVFILFEYGPTWIPVWLDRKHSDDPDPTWWGESIGQYENGDTLVVDTVGFNDKTWLDQVGRPHSEKLHLTQRFKRVDKTHLQLDVAFDDPGAYTKLWTGQKIFSLSNAGFARYLWVCTIAANKAFDEKVEKPTVPAAGPR
jgi:hypothetical protein